MNTEGQIKINDFGVSEYIEKKFEKKQYYFDTNNYKSPEFLQGLKHEPLSDIWLLGIIVYECIYGRCPFKYKDDYDLVDQIKNFSIPKDANEDLRHFVETCLQFEAENRMSAKDLLQHPWLTLARRIHADGKIDSFCRKFIFKIIKMRRNL